MAWVTSFMDGMDYYATADVGAKWDYTTMSVTIDSSVFRNSGQSLRASASSSDCFAKRLNIAARNVVLGFGFRTAGVSTANLVSAANSTLFVLSNDVNTGSNAQFALCLLNDGKLHAARCTNTVGSGLSGTVTDLGTGLVSIAANTWYYIEVRIYIHDTLGAVEIKVNGVADITLTGIDTKANASLDVVEQLQIRAQSSNNYFDDLYVRTEASSTEVTGGFLGDIKIKPYFPNGDGTYTAMTCSTGSTHYTLVDEALPNTTDYVSSSTALQKDSFNFQDASETGSIKAVQLSAYCYKMDAGFRGVDVFVKSGATENFATSQPLSTTGKYASKVWDQDPNTSADWSQTNLNAAEFGVRISADL